MRDALSALLIWVLYPVWLMAGAGDYLCHRATAIERTSGATESWLHVAQFVCLALALACATLMGISAAVFIVLVVLVLTHSGLSYIDVRYTDGRRRILPIEQTLHGFMDVLPLVAVAVLGVQHWQEIHTGSLQFSLRPAIDLNRVLLLSSFAVLAGFPVLEELVRTTRSPFTRAWPPSDKTLRPAPERR
jgi:hypothetical protein